MSTPPYDPVILIINNAKVRLNDDITTLAAIGGKILDNTQPFTQQMANNGFRKLQEYLAELGYSGLEQEAFFGNVPAATTTDPTVQIYLNYAGYFDGTTLQSAPILPQNFIRPYRLWERAYAAGTNAALMTEMDYVINGLPAIPKLQWNRQWEWRNDNLYMPGATVATDLRIRFAQSFLDFTDVGGSPGLNQLANTPWFSQPVPIMRCDDALSDYFCREIKIAVGDMDAAMAFEMSARTNAQLILNRDTAQPKATFKASEYGKMSDPRTPQQNSPNVQPIKR